MSRAHIGSSGPYNVWTRISPTATDRRAIDLSFTVIPARLNRCNSSSGLRRTWRRWIGISPVSRTCWANQSQGRCIGCEVRYCHQLIRFLEAPEKRPFSRAKEPACRGRFCTRRSHRPPTKPGTGTRRRPSRNPTNPLAPLNKVPLGWRRLSAAMSFVSLRRTSSHAGRTALPSPSPRRRLSVEHFTAGCVLRITPDPR
jgi:hypothetical protein